MSRNRKPTPLPFANNWTLDKKVFCKSIYKRTTDLVERPPVRMVDAFLADPNLGIKFQKRHPQKASFDNEKAHVSNYRELYDPDDGFFHVTVSLPKHKWGRVKPQDHLSLSVMHRPTRHAFCSGVYIDIDMINAHPRILRAIVMQNEYNTPDGSRLELPCLSRYIDECKTVRKEVAAFHQCSEESVKKLHISLGNGGSYEAWVREYDIKHPLIANNEIERMDWIDSYEKEMSRVMNIVYANNPQIFVDILAYDSDRLQGFKTREDKLAKKKRTTMAMWSQTIERAIQECMIKHLVDAGYSTLEDIVPCQDGFMMLAKDFKESHIEEIERVQQEKFGFVIPMQVKPFNEAIDIAIPKKVRRKAATPQEL